MANALSLILPLLFTFAVAIWGPLAVDEDNDPDLR